MTASNLLDNAWDWQMFGGRWRLHIARPNGNGYASLILQGENGGGILTRDPESSAQRLIVPTDDLAKIIAAAPCVRRHSRALINGINLGFLDISDEAEPSFRAVVAQLREALARSGAI